MHGNHPQTLSNTAAPEPRSTFLLITGHRSLITERKGWTTWWSSRGARTRSHPELGRENPQRPWYCVLRHGRVGRRQVLQPFPHKPIHRPPNTPADTPIRPTSNTNKRSSNTNNQYSKRQPNP